MTDKACIGKKLRQYIKYDVRKIKQLLYEGQNAMMGLNRKNVLQKKTKSAIMKFQFNLFYSNFILLIYWIICNPLNAIVQNVDMQIYYLAYYSIYLLHYVLFSDILMKHLTMK